MFLRLPEISDDDLKMSNVAKNVPRCSDDLWALPKLFKRQQYYLVRCMWYSMDTKSKLRAFWSIFRENWINIYLSRTEDFVKNELHMPQHVQGTTLTSFVHNLANQKNWIFLFDQILPLVSRARDLVPFKQRLHSRYVGWRAKTSLCRQSFKSVQKSGQINFKNGLFLYLPTLTP